MFCEKCGNKIEDGDKNCSVCGAPVRTRGEQVSRKNTPVKNKRRIWPLVLVLVLVAALAAGGVAAYFYFNGDRYRVRKHMQLGQRYLKDLKYEEAEAEFKAAIEISPKESGPYLSLSRTYVEMSKNMSGNSDDMEWEYLNRALEVLYDGRDALGADGSSELEVEIKNIEEGEQYINLGKIYIEDETTETSTVEPIASDPTDLEPTDSKPRDPDELRKEYKEKLKSEAGVDDDSILSFEMDDYDLDGEYECFAFVGEKISGGSEETTYEGDVWYVNDKLCQEIKSDTNYWSVGNRLDFKKRKYIYYNQYFTTDALSFIFTSKDGEPYESRISGYGDINSNDNNNMFTVTYSAYDIYYDPGFHDFTGHSWKPYFFYYDESEDGLREYKGKETDRDGLRDIVGKDIIGEAVSDEYEIHEIYVRDNGIITINLCLNEETDHVYYGHLTYDLKGNCFMDDNGDQLTGSQVMDGSYKECICSQVAVYKGMITAAASAARATVKPYDESWSFTPAEHEEAIEYIRGIYYDFTGNPGDYNKKTEDRDLQAYFYKSNDKLVCIKADAGTYEDVDPDGEYRAEFFYENSGISPILCFAFIYSKEGKEEYRYYLKNGYLIRYIGPYSSKETTEDYLSSEDDPNVHETSYKLMLKGQMEPYELGLAYTE